MLLFTIAATASQAPPAKPTRRVPRVPDQLTPQHVHAMLADLRASAQQRGIYKQPQDPHGEHLVVPVAYAGGAGERPYLAGVDTGGIAAKTPSRCPGAVVVDSDGHNRSAHERGLNRLRSRGVTPRTSRVTAENSRRRRSGAPGVQDLSDAAGKDIPPWEPATEAALNSSVNHQKHASTTFIAAA